ncbi:hypothetical protein FNV43_RR04226 [Rhamnella rubrinervis]|uniref:Uncharacterized protein n=1 Tax=Rhamnella rubrinervis TaxID=2594499 RepID=A0A8K0MQE1_9ROSA|nr:hypothetical protein FNV43_RR04226 [Rhamnella rubrinervis]
MGFFDLNVPYLESSPSYKTTRIKLATLAMELGYSGIAYNRTIKGIMSDHDRCSIPLLTLSTLLKLSPSLSSSVYFHRNILGVPRTSPFRQYRRLTVCSDNLSQAQALNSGNPILKTYDFVAVSPMNQSVFDQACEKLEVDMIAIDFSEKLPFRLKMPMVKAAIERGVYFEITYSNLIADIQSRKQMISNAKLLVDWTRGKNLIISSAAPTVFELRGPYDVANLSSLLGMSMERAKAALSKNCRSLITKALRKRQFYKEAIKVEVASSNEPLSSDWFKWDPISSGEGDLQLDDIAKSFAASSEATKTVKSIDFTSVIDSMPSHGFQVKDLITKAQVVSQSQEDRNNVISTAEIIVQPVRSDGNLDQSNRLDFPVAGQTLLQDTCFKHQTFENEKFQKLVSPCDTTFTDSVEIRAPIATNEGDLNKPSTSDADINLIRAESHNLRQEKCVDSYELQVELSDEKATFHMSDIGLCVACNADSKVESTPFKDRNLSAHYEEDKGLKSSEVLLGKKGDLIDEDLIEVVTENQEATSLVLDENIKEQEQIEELEDDPVTVLDEVPILESTDVMRVRDNYSAGNHEPAEVTMEEQKHGKADTGLDHLISSSSVSGKSKSKRKIPHQACLLPLKRILTPPFKKKAYTGKKKAKLRSNQ